MMYQNGARLADGLGFNFAGLYFHCIFFFIFVVGVVLLVSWMVKNLKPEKLLWAALGLAVVGLLGALMTMPYEAEFIGGIVGNRGQVPFANNMMYNRGFNGQQQLPAGLNGQPIQLQPGQLQPGQIPGQPLPGQIAPTSGAIMKISTQQKKP